MTGEHTVVIGGGVVGLAVARDLARDRAVTLLEQGSLAGGATGRAAGLVSIAADYGAFPAVASHALTRFESFDGQYGFQYHPTVSLERPSSSRGPLDDAASRIGAAGIDADHVSATEAEEDYPALRSADDGFLRFNRGGWLDPSEFAEALARAASERGADLRTGVTVQGVVEDDAERVAAVETDAGRVDADAVVVAAGWRTTDLLESVVTLPVRPYRTQCVVFELDDRADVPMGWSPDHEIYWRPTREGHVLVGGGSHLIDRPQSASRDASPAFRERVAALFADLFAVERGDEVDHWAGVDGATPDAYPIIDAPDEGPAGLVVATGLHGRGVMAAFSTAALVRHQLGGDPPLQTAAFSLDRFAARDRDFDFVSVSA